MPWLASGQYFNALLLPERVAVAQNRGELPINWNVCANTSISNNKSSIIVILAQFSNMGPWTWKWNSCDGNDRPILRPIKQFKFSFSPLLRALQKILCMYWTKKGKLQPKRLVKIYITCIKSSSFVKTTLANFMIRVLLLDLEIWKENF